MLLEDLKRDHAEVVLGGSVYPTKNGKLGFAFYYRTGGERKRKVVTGDTEEALKDKAVKFLNEVEKGK